MRYKVVRPFPFSQPLRVGQVIDGVGLRNAPYLVRQRYLQPVEESPAGGVAPGQAATPAMPVPSPAPGSGEAAAAPRRRRRDK